MVEKTPRLYLEHIREAIAIIERRVAGRTLANLASDDALRDAIERRIGVISEASRRLPADMKARHPEVPWHNVADIRFCRGGARPAEVRIASAVTPSAG